MPNGLAIAGGVSWPLLAPDGSAASPSYSFASAPTYGLYLRAGAAFDISLAGVTSFDIQAAAVNMRSGQVLGWAAADDASGSTDLNLVRDAADTFAQRRGANEQMFRLYGTYTSATNYERLDLGCTTSSYNLATAKGSAGGTLRSLGLYGAPIYLGTSVGNGGVASSTTRWEVSTAGHFLAFADNTYDVGDATHRVRTLWCPFLQGGSHVAHMRLDLAGSDTTQGTFIYNGVNVMSIGSNGSLCVVSTGYIGFSSAASSVPIDVAFTRIGSASIRLGISASATPIAQTFTIGESSRPGTDSNVGGANGTIRSGLGTGTGTASSLIFQTPDLVASGSTTQTYTTRLTASKDSITSTVQILAPVGSTGVLSYGFATANYGMYLGAAGGGSAIIFTCGATDQWAVGQNSGVGTQQIGPLGFTAAISSSVADLQLARLAAASLRLGQAPSATPIAQVFTIGESSRGGTDLNVAGADGTIRSGLGTGNAAGTSLIFQVSVPLASSTVAQTYTQVLSLSALGATFDIPDQGLRINGQVSGAGAGAGTLGNAPAAGNPTFWLPINVAGTVRFCPLW